MGEVVPFAPRNRQLQGPERLAVVERATPEHLVLGSFRPSVDHLFRVVDAVHEQTGQQIRPAGIFGMAWRCIGGNDQARSLVMQGLSTRVDTVIDYEMEAKPRLGLGALQPHVLHNPDSSELYIVSQGEVGLRLRESAIALVGLTNRHLADENAPVRLNIEPAFYEYADNEIK